ncbi:MAG: hypothetical protein AB1791_19740 [Chloroflexota bacterium]
MSGEWGAAGWRRAVFLSIVYHKGLNRLFNVGDRLAIDVRIMLGGGRGHGQETGHSHKVYPSTARPDIIRVERFKMLQVTLNLDERHTKELFKQALLEMLAERNEMLYRVLAEVLEDVALANAIREGESSPTVGRDEVFAILGEAA